MKLQKLNLVLLWFFWLPSLAVLIINIISQSFFLGETPLTDFLESNFLSYNHSPFEEIQNFYLMWMIWILYKGGRNGCLTAKSSFRWGLLGLLLFVLGDEIAWGRIYLGFQTPKWTPFFLSEDFDVHNLTIFQAEMSDVFEVLGAMFIPLIFMPYNSLGWIRTKLNFPDFTFAPEQYFMYIFANVTSIFAIFANIDEFDIIYENMVYVTMLWSLLSYAEPALEVSESTLEPRKKKIYLFISATTIIFPIIKLFYLASYSYIET